MILTPTSNPAPSPTASQPSAPDPPVQDQTHSGGDDDSTRGGLTVISTLHETVELVPETESKAKPMNLGGSDTGSRGKWHEKFGRGR